MNTLRRLCATSLSVVLFSGIGLAIPVSAHATDNVLSSTSSTPHVEKSTAEPNTVTTEHTTADTSTSTDNTEDGTKSTNLRDQFRALAQQDVANKKAQVKEQSQAERQKVCETRKNGLAKRMAAAVKDAQAHKTYFDNVYAKVKAFHDSKGLTVSNYDALVATADGAASAASTSISALQSLDVSVDCTSTTVADSVGAFQQAVKATRDSLKTYRTDIIAVITALKGTSTSNGGGQ